MPEYRKDREDIYGLFRGIVPATCGAGNSQSPAGRRNALLCGYLRV